MQKFWNELLHDFSNMKQYSKEFESKIKEKQRTKDITFFMK